MEDNFDRALKQILRSEGGYVDHPQDPGGCTNKGITLNTLHAHFPGDVIDCSDVRNIRMETVEAIYREGYWDEIEADSLPSGLDLVVFDMAVNAGPGRAAKLLQRIVGTDQDGYIGPVTLKAVSDLVRRDDLLGMIGAYSKARRKYYRGLRHFATFGKGWLRRVEEAEEEAYKLAAEVAQTEPEVTPGTISLSGTGFGVAQAEPEVTAEAARDRYSAYLSDLHAAMLKAINAAFVEAYAQAEELEKSA